MEHFKEHFKDIFKGNIFRQIRPLFLVNITQPTAIG